MLFKLGTEVAIDILRTTAVSAVSVMLCFPFGNTEKYN